MQQRELSSSMTGNMTNPTNATKSPGAVGGGNMTSPSSAKAANETAGTQTGGNNSMAGGSEQLLALEMQRNLAIKQRQQPINNQQIKLGIIMETH